MNFGTPLRPHRNHFYLGLDLGQRCDHSALVILERVHELTGRFDHANYVHETATRLYLQHAERFPLNFPYLEIPRAIHSLISKLDPPSYQSAPPASTPPSSPLPSPPALPPTATTSPAKPCSPTSASFSKPARYASSLASPNSNTSQGN